MDKFKIRLNDIYSSWTSNGFFTQLYNYLTSQSITKEWLPSASTTPLDLQYHGNHSGDKLISSLVYKLYKIDEEEIQSSTLTEIVKTFFVIYQKDIDRMWEVYTTEYEPSENYNMIEHGADGKKDSKTTTTVTPNEHNVQVKTDSDVYGFNSSTAVNSGDVTQTTTYNGDPTITTISGWDAQNNSQSMQNPINEQTLNGFKETNEHYFIRHGNIGVTTTQQMLESEIALWQWNFYNSYLFKVLDKFLTLSIY